jgi:hypothetical protein
MSEHVSPRDAAPRTAASRALGIGSVVCCATALGLAAFIVGNSIYGYLQGVPAAAGLMALLMAMFHATGLVGTVLGFAGMRRDGLARFGAWLNPILLVVFWLGVALWPI